MEPGAPLPSEGQRAVTLYTSRCEKTHSLTMTKSL